jgi:hypothetical protein
MAQGVLTAVTDCPLDDAEQRMMLEAGATIRGWVDSS